MLYYIFVKSKLKIYLDTSVISAVLDGKNPERQSLTKDFFKLKDDFTIFISEVTQLEINQTPIIELRREMNGLIMGMEILELTKDDEELAAKYVEKGAIPTKYAEDALHIAIAVNNNMDYLLSWNFKHIVKLKTKNIVRLVNTLTKIAQIEIITPAELLE